MKAANSQSSTDQSRAKPSWARKLPLSLIRRLSAQMALDPELITAVVMAESGGDAFAIRHEPKWKYFCKPEQFADALGILPETEMTNQATSWGLMQVMGSVARELGYRDSLPGLQRPELGLAYGCKKLTYCLKRENGDFEAALARYNGGSPRRDEFGELEDQLQRYVTTVMGYYNELRRGTNG